MGVWCYWTHSPALPGKRLRTVILDWEYSFTVRIIEYYPVSKDTGQGTQFKGTEESESSLLSVLPELLHILGLGPQQGRSDS